LSPNSPLTAQEGSAGPVPERTLIMRALVVESPAGTERVVAYCRPVKKKDYFGDEVAAVYDGGPMFSPEVLDPTVDFLVSLAGDGAALEFGVGTGRVAVPLSQRGVCVHGIDLSEAMVAKLREKPGAEQIGTKIGDFVSTRVNETFSLVYLVFNTIGTLTKQDDQGACFQNAADHIERGGYFVIEVGIPELRRLPPGCSGDASVEGSAHTAEAFDARKFSPRRATVKPRRS
jgi:SAM-dependent methyltransferase